MSEPTVTVRGMSEAFRRWQQAERELHRLQGYRRLTPGMKDDEAKWRDIRARAERYLRHGPSDAVPLP